MTMMYVDPKTQEHFERLAAKLGRSPEEIPELALSILDWYVEHREQGYELFLGLRDDPDDRNQVHLFRVPEFRVVRMDEDGVDDLGKLDL